MTMPGAALVRSRALLVTLALAAAGCSSTSNTAVTASGTTLTIYASRPPAGAGGQTVTDLLDAEQLAFQQSSHTVGKFTVRLREVSKSELSANARAAVSDSSAIAYLGELVPGTSQISVEINNELDLLEVSPADTAVYLTQETPADPGSPGKYYPSGTTYHQTFARVVPTTAQEAQAIVGQMQALHVGKVYVGSDGGTYGAVIAAEVRSDARAHGMTVVGGAAAADAVFYGGNSAAAAVQALGAAASASPAAKLFVPSALYDQSFVSQLSAAAQKNLYVSSPGFSSATLPAAGKQFVSSFTSAFGHAPVPQAIFGYEAMSAVLAILREAGSKAANRAQVVADFRALHDRQSVLGTYSLSGGDPTISPFVFARARGGTLVPVSGS